jgi:hypothetical protein
MDIETHVTHNKTEEKNGSIARREEKEGIKDNNQKEENDDQAFGPRMSGRYK